ncbi:MAG: glycosyltransferase family 39 protein [Armatimonadetes bacterium]|nr:glycosyltransferase family 39 protein [Armatimonadota bacterium]
MLLRLFTEYDNYIYAGVVRGMEHGLMPYRGVFDQKLPALYLTFYALIRLFGDSPVPIQLFYLFCTFGLSLCVFCLARRIGAGSGVSAIAVLLMLSWPIRLTRGAGYLSSLQVWFNNTGLLLAFAQSLCLLLAVSARKPRWWFLIGLLAGWAVWIKPQEALFLLLLVLWLWRSPQHSSCRLPALGFLATGFAAVSAGVLAWLAGHRLFSALAEVMRYNAHYVRDTPLSSGFVWVWEMVRGGPEPLVFGALAAFAAAWASKSKRDERDNIRLLCIGWVICGAISVVLGRRSFTHSLLPVMAACAVLSAGVLSQFLGWMRDRLDGRGRLGMRAAISLIFVLTLLAGMDERVHRNLALWAHSVRPFDLKDEWAVNAWKPRNVQLGLWLRSQVPPDGQVFVYGPSSPQILYESGFSPATRFIWPWPLEGHYGGSLTRQPEALTQLFWSQWLADMRRSQPALILDETGVFTKAVQGKAAFPLPIEAARFVQENYKFEHAHEGFGVLRRK